ncbi:MAG: hypothetical protein ACJAZ0_001571 [Halioglobus sp.]|jgi:hypothetical protein
MINFSDNQPLLLEKMTNQVRWITLNRLQQQWASNSCK